MQMSVAWTVVLAAVAREGLAFAPPPPGAILGCAAFARPVQVFPCWACCARRAEPCSRIGCVLHTGSGREKEKVAQTWRCLTRIVHTPAQAQRALGAARPGVSLLRMQGSDDVGRWQDVAENLADPFVSPFDKPALLLKLVQRAPDVAQTLSDVVQGKEQPDKMLGSRAQRQLRGVQAVSRQLTQDVLPDALPQVQRVVEEVSRNPRLVGGGQGFGSQGDGGGVQRVVQILDDLTANGKFPTLPSFSDVAGELRQVFESTPLVGLFCLCISSLLTLEKMTGV
jgi:hypothetical protein